MSTPDPEPRRLKAELRRKMQDRLRLVGPEEARLGARAVAERTLALPEVAGSRRLLACLSFGGELDTWGLVEELVAAGKEVLVPRTEPADRSLTLHPYPCELETLSFGLRQPAPGAAAIPAEEVDGLDAALLLGLAYDRSGVRLGHGAGYFDRFLAGRSFPSFGLGYDFQLVETLPVEAHDVRLTGVVVEWATVRPGSPDDPDR